jgi:two-component system CheB/CheR fusion protein
VAPTTSETQEREVLETVQRAEELSALQLVETILQQSDTPPCAIINDASNVIYIHGRTGRFLEPAEGKASMNIVEMARSGLKAELATAIRQVATHKQEVTYRGLRVQYNSGQLFLNLTVKPILEQIAMRGLMMVVFDETEAPTKAEQRVTKQSSTKRKGKRPEEIERELQHTRESLQTTIEELETSNEELKSTNEELQSTNEELQSTNEELETSKEELQSLNEESATVNAELQARIDELSTTNDDMKNLLDATEIATIFLDTDLRVRRFTPKATEIVPLTAADSGRPIKHLASTLRNTDLSKCGQRVLRDLAVREAEVESEDERSFIMRVRPYRTVGNVIDGVVITFDETTQRKKLERQVRRELEAELRMMSRVFLDGADPIVIEDMEGRIVNLNDETERVCGWTREELIGETFKKLVPSECHEQADELLKRCKAGEVIRNIESLWQSRAGEEIPVLLTLSLLTDEEGKAIGMATISKSMAGLKGGR